MRGDAVTTGCIKIDVDGAWSYDGIEMTRRDIVRLFYRHLRQDVAGGWSIQIGRQQYPVQVEDTAYVVWALTWSVIPVGQEAVAYLHLSDDTIEELDAHTLRVRNDGVPCCRVKNGGFEARLSRPSYNSLTERIEYDPVSDSYVLSLGSRSYPVIVA